MKDPELKSLYKTVAKISLMIVASVLLCRVTEGFFSIILVALGIGWAMTNAYGKSLACFALFPFMIVLSPAILPKTSILAIALRLGPLAIGVVLCIISFGRRGSQKLPFSGLLLYLAVSIVSSYGGWAPFISYLKMVNFFLYFVGIWIGTQNIHEKPKEMYFIRCFILSLVCVLAFGGVLSLPFPAVCYSTSLTYSVDKMATLQALYSTGGVVLFSGITNQSQALAPITACLITFTLADMIFVMKRKTMLHIILLVICGWMLFKTRSRTGLFATAVGVTFVLIYAPQKIKVSERVKRTIKRLAAVGLTCAFIVVVFGEVSNRMVTKWILKTNDIEAVKAERGFEEGLTGSRQRLIQESWDEFYMNPMFGMGFQVNWGSQELFGDQGFVMSAPVEKGLLPMTILGEGGIVGSIAFVIFLIGFYVGCHRRHYIITIVMFTTFLATNIGEATFFSPGGIGGILWVFGTVGGYILDMLMYSEHRRAQIFK